MASTGSIRRAVGEDGMVLEVCDTIKAKSRQSASGVGGSFRPPGCWICSGCPPKHVDFGPAADEDDELVAEAS